MIAEEEQCPLDVEIQSLKAIFAEELEVNRTEDDKESVKRLVLQMSPESAKGENLQFVRFEIVLEIPLEYPQAIPKIALRNVRGLSEEAQARTKEHMICRAEELSGNAMLFELIQVAKELLTSENTPSIPCSICLFSFDTEDSFSRTPCFHFFHTHCLAKHVQHSLAQNNSSEDKGPPNDLSKGQEQDVLCPVCRLAIPFEESDPEKFPVPRESLKEEDKVVITPELKEMQEKMAALYSEQLARGSIIDLESEKNKYFIEISNTPDIQVLSSASVSPNLVRQANDAANSDSVNKSSTESGAEHVPKRHDASSKKYYSSNSGRQSYYDKANSRYQTKKPAWKNGRSAEVKEKVLEDIDWCQESEATPPSSASKKGNRKDTQKTSEQDEAERGDGEASQDRSAAGNEDGPKKNYDYPEDYRGRQRRQYNDKKQRSKKDTTGERNQPGGSGGQDWNQEDSVTQEDNKDHRFNKKKNFRKYKNFDENSGNPDGTGEGASSKSEVLSGDQEGSSNRRNQSSERPARYGSRNWKNYPRNTDSDYENRTRYFRQNRYNRPYENRYPRDRQAMVAEDGTQEISNAEVSDQVEQNCETTVQAGEYSENRFRNSYSRYRNNFVGQNRTRERSQNNKMGNGANSESKDQGETQAEESRTHNPKRFFKGGAYRGPRGRYSGRQETSRKESGGSEDNTHPTEVHGEFGEKRYEPNESNRRFQKSYPNENESSKVVKDIDDAAAADETQEQTGVRWPRYRNRNDKFKKNPQKIFSEHDNGNVSTANTQEQTNVSATDTQEHTNPNESNAYGSSTHEINAQMGKENFRYHQERRPKYKKNNSNYSREWNDSEQLDNKEQAAHDEQANLGKGSYDVSQSEPQGEQPVYKRNWSDSRTNRRENSKFGNWKERNRYQRNYGQATSATPTSIQSKSESSSKSDPSSLKQNITPFTHLYNSTAQDAQVMVSIPPPFSKEG